TPLSFLARPGEGHAKTTQGPPRRLHDSHQAASHRPAPPDGQLDHPAPLPPPCRLSHPGPAAPPRAGAVTPPGDARLPYRAAEPRGRTHPISAIPPGGAVVHRS